MRSAAAVTTLFFAAALWLTSFHELWRDELHSWTVARGAESLASLWERAVYEGSPVLWHYLLFAVTRVVPAPEGMQALHLLVASAAVFTLVRYAPLPFALKALFPFGYYALYEYGVIARNYGLGMLFAFVFCALYSSRRSRAPAMAVALVLLANSNLYGLILAVAFVPLFARRVGERRGAGPQRVALLAAVGLGCGLALFQIVLPEDIGHVRPALDAATFLRAAATLHASYLPIPPWTDAFWNKNFLGPVELRAASSVLLFAATSLILASRRSVLLLTYLPAAGAIALACVLHIPYARHMGHWFVLLVCAVWLAEATTSPARGGRWAQRAWSLRYGFLALVFSAQAVAAGVAGAKEVVRPFSAIEATAQLVVREGWDARPLAAHQDFSAIGVAQLLGREAYLPRGGDTADRVRWNLDRLRDLDEEEVLVRIADRALELGAPLTAILSYDVLTTASFLELLHPALPDVIDGEALRVYAVDAQRGLVPIPGERLGPDGLRVGGRTYELRAGALEAAVERSTEYGSWLVLEGYAFDRAARRPATAIAVLVRDDVVMRGALNLPWPSFEPDAGDAGFRLLVPRPADQGAVLRLFALSESGLATELVRD